MSEITFVTALYYSNYYDVIGGRGYDTSYYFPNLISLCKLEGNLIIYTHLREKNKLIEALEKIGFTKYLIRVIEFEDFPYHQYIINKKKELYFDQVNDIVNDRCHHVFWQKPIWLADEIKTNAFETKYHLWIDIGLFHHGIFPESIGGTERFVIMPDEYYYPHNHNNIFNPDLRCGIESFLFYNQSLFLALISNNKQKRIEDLFSNYKNEKIHVVAGMFGGAKQLMIDFAKEYQKELNQMVENNEFLLEEPLMTNTLINNMEKYAFLPFTHFVHSIEGNPCYIPKEKNQYSFWEIFNNLRQY